jgi:dihydroneopterin aldolase
VRQPVFDLELPTDAASAAATDDLRDAFDYGAVARRVCEIIAASRCGSRNVGRTDREWLLGEYSIDG